MRKLVAIKEIAKFNLYDITVADDHAFELENGVIAHNSMYPKAIVSGGCMVEGTKIQLANGNLIEMQATEVGMEVKTLNGPRPISAVWNPDTLFEGEPNCYEVEFEDGSTYVCSDEHMFKLGNDWVEINQLKIGDDVASAQ